MFALVSATATACCPLPLRTAGCSEAFLWPNSSLHTCLLISAMSLSTMAVRAGSPSILMTNSVYPSFLKKIMGCPIACPSSAFFPGSAITKGSVSPRALHTGSSPKDSPAQDRSPSHRPLRVSKTAWVPELCSTHGALALPLTGRTSPCC